MFGVTGIDFQTNTKVSGVDIKGKSVSTETGDKISFEKLIIALGSVVRLATKLLSTCRHLKAKLMLNRLTHRSVVIFDFVRYIQR